MGDRTRVQEEVVAVAHYNLVLLSRVDGMPINFVRTHAGCASIC